MAEVTTELVKELREKTGAGIGDCRKALMECEGDIEKAGEWLREKGIASAGKRAGKSANQGLIFSYIHGEGKVGVLLEVNCETDFVARTEDFKELCKDIAMQIAAMNPLYVRREEVPLEVIEKEKEIYTAQMAETKKPANIIEKIVLGKLDKYFSEVCLLEQLFVKDDTKNVDTLVKEKIGKIGENISVKRFARFVLGENV
ncbi:MAG: Elongation factor Ts [Candidatus Aerophobetes bacterium ADurb.Bin490]|nr:MAG: Elongation factor Ts [Candidatus Aerophobetes bacterium ADurb.Bin490]HPI02512.1 translation elongation factor Ts [Candidatus Goldiibacteriota bacterium]HPN65335.1 translation elongation factor Ts [Candidatus Goldiibacteriota bacterium]HRQ42870.1 translation elongation factor Ts [Candidatus Goldiibacteriota bacterium]